jgi:hypothetical protein
MMVVNSFFASNTCNCLFETMTEFNIWAPTLEEYLPLDEVIPSAQGVGVDQLGKTFVYYCR